MKRIVEIEIPDGLFCLGKGKEDDCKYLIDNWLCSKYNKNLKNRLLCSDDGYKSKGLFRYSGIKCDQCKQENS